MNVFNLPDLGEGLPDAQIREWYVKEGDEVTVDQPLVAMETAKALVDVPSPYTGKIIKLHGKVGDTINTDEPLVTYDAEAQGVTPPGDRGTVVGQLEEASTTISEDIAVATGAVISSRIKASPAIRALAKKLNVDLSSVTPTGPAHTITAEDVKNLAETTGTSSKTHTTSSLNADMQPLSAVRRAMAASMTHSHHTIVPVTIVDDADLSSWDKKQDITLRLVRAIAAACEAEPMLNAHFDGQQLTFRFNKVVNLGIAVDTSHGLYVPVLKDIANQDNVSLRSNIERLKIQAQERSIAPNDMRGATIMLSNFGVYAGRYANPIVTPPMVAIIGVGRARDEMVIINREPQIRRMLPISLSIDHRAVTGGEAARFLKFVMDELAKPS